MEVVWFVIHVVLLPDVLDGDSFMKIIVFGMKRCEFCKVQKGYLKETFNDDDWLYVDVVKDVENLRIANTIDIDKLPTIVLLDEMNREIYRKEGTLSADRIFSILNSEDNKKIPAIKKTSTRTLLSYDPNLSKGSEIEIYEFNGKFLHDAKVKSCRRVKVSSLLDNAKKVYKKLGGRKDICWIVDFEIKKGYQETK